MKELDPAQAAMKQLHDRAEEWIHDEKQVDAVDFAKLEKSVFASYAADAQAKLTLEDRLENKELFSFNGNYRRHADYINEYLVEKYGIENIEDVPEEKRLELTSLLVHCLVDEAQEVLRELPWKPWKTNHRDMSTVDLDAIRMEIVDVQHFVNNLIMVWFDDVAQFHAYFNEKLSENVDRQKRGY